MACGTPVVASENPGSVDVLAGGCGLMPADEDFASAIASLLGDEEARVRLSRAGLMRAQDFSLARMLDGYEKVLFELTGAYVKSMASV